MVTEQKTHHPPAPQRDEASVPLRFYHEINLLRIEGMYFCFDPKEAARREKKQSFNETIKSFDQVLEKPLIIEPDPRYGWPGIVAYKVLQAIFQKLSWYGYPLPGSVQLSNRELARLIGRKHFSGRTAEQLFQAIMQLTSTKVWCSIFNKETGKWKAVQFQMIFKLEAEGNRGRLSSITFYIEPAIIESINKNHYFSLNYTRIEGLAPIAVALYKHVFYHSSNIFSQLKRRDFTFRKDYADICETWLGGLKILRYKSDILKDQLGRHLDALVETRLVSSYEIEKNKAGTGFNLIFSPGEAFYADYTLFYGSDFQLELDLLQKQGRGEEEASDSQADEVVLRFHAKRLGRNPAMERISHKERAFAQELLERYSPDEIEVFLDFALSEAQKTNYRPRTLGGIKQYLADFETERAARQSQARQAAEQRLNRQQEIVEKRLQDAYEKHRTNALEAYREQLTQDELSAIEKRCRREAEEEFAKTPYMVDMMTRMKVNTHLGRQVGFPPFEEWKKQNT